MWQVSNADESAAINAYLEKVKGPSTEGRRSALTRVDGHAYSFNYEPSGAKPVFTIKSDDGGKEKKILGNKPLSELIQNRIQELVRLPTNFGTIYGPLESAVLKLEPPSNYDPKWFH
jgi:hypothetical protein